LARGATDSGVDIAESPCMHDPRNLGSAGERAARKYLQRRGWTILATNLRGSAEIDLVAQRAGFVIGCEVKTRHDRHTGYPSVSHAQRLRLMRALEAFVTIRQGLHKHQLRLDLLLVEPRVPGMRVRHLPGALGDPDSTASNSFSLGYATDWNDRR